MAVTILPWQHLYTSSDKTNMLNILFSRCFNFAVPPVSPELFPTVDLDMANPELLSEVLCTEEEICDHLYLH